MDRRNASRCSSEDTEMTDFEHSFEIIDDADALEERCQEYLFGGALTRFEAGETVKNVLRILNDHSARLQRNSRYTQLARKLVKLMTGEEIDFPSSTEEPYKLGRSTASPDPDFAAPKGQRLSKHKFSNASAANILALVDKGASLKTIQAQYRHYNSGRLQELRDQVAGNAPRTQFEIIDRTVLERVVDARRRGHVVRGWMIQQWAVEHARSLGNMNFRASLSWLNLFKKRDKIVSRKINKVTSRAKEANAEKIESSKFAFLDYFERQRIRFHDRLIFNFDQSGFEYEMSAERTLSWQGERDTMALADQANKATHSYTIQPTVSRDGRMLGKLLICMQEPTGRFGPRTSLLVREAEAKFKNVRVFASKSGKMSAALMRQWVEEELIPPIKELATNDPPPAQCEEPIGEPEPSCSYTQRVETGVRPTALVLADSWGGNLNQGVQDILTAGGVQFLQIPAGTTDQLQPCDMEIFRQWKYFLRRLTMQGHYDGLLNELTSRIGVINVQSLIFNQFSALSYRDLIKFSWRHADRSFSTSELSSGEEPIRTSKLQFSFQPGSSCEHEECEAYAFMQCSHCSRLLCAKHFLERVCFHEVDEEADEELNFNDEDFDEDLIHYEH